MSFQEYADSLEDDSRRKAKKRSVLKGIVAVAVLVAVAAIAVIAPAFSSSEQFQIERADEASAEQGAQAEQVDPEPTLIVVHVGGAVQSPGVYEIPEGSRVGQAIEAAGGASEDAVLDALNLARVVTDGEQVLVPAQSDSEEGPSESVSAATAGAGGASSKVNINTADAAALDSLPGVGPATAQRIVSDRQANGPFKTTEDLKRVSGIGDKKFAQLADSITV